MKKRKWIIKTIIQRRDLHIIITVLTVWPSSSAALGFLAAILPYFAWIYKTTIKKFWYLVSYIFCFSFCLLFSLDGMFAVEKYKLLLPQLVKNIMHQISIYFCDETLRAVYFQIKCAKIVSISVIHWACFLGTLRFYNKSFAIWEDSKVCE